MIPMEAVVPIAGLVLIAIVVLAILVIRVLARSDSRPRRATPQERAANQAEVEDWIARTKGEDHVKRMRGDT